MIEKMAKIRLLSLKKDKDKLLNEIFRLGLIEIKSTTEFEETQKIKLDVDNIEKIKSEQKRYFEAINFLEKATNKKPKDDIVLSRDDIINLSLDAHIKNLNLVEKLKEEIDKINLETTNLAKKRDKFVPYMSIPERLSGFQGTKHTDVFLGTIFDDNGMDKAILELGTLEFVAFERINNVLKVFSHKSQSEKTWNILKEVGFTRLDEYPPFTAQEVVLKLDKEMLRQSEKRDKLLKCAENYKDYITEFKIVYDYLEFNLSKIQADEMFSQTNYTFFIEGYFAKKDEKRIKDFLDDLNLSIEYDFLPLDKADDAPTIVTNNPLIKPFEFITNTYSVPKSRELDPNLFVAIFFSLFFGFVMADIGYGLLFVIFCAPLYFVTRGSYKSLMGILTISGVFTIIFGVLFGSFFGMDNSVWEAVPKAIIRDPTDNVYLMLALCLIAGVVQIAVSYVLKGVMLVKKKEYLSSIFSGFMWVGVFIGVSLFALSLVSSENLQNVGLIISAVSLVIIVLGEVCINKGVSRLTKPFSSIYSIINIMSDTLSYARLYGLMLSGAIISSIVNDLATPFFASPYTFIVGIIILLIGHGFNLSMGALSAYIHVSRLQYIEFFSRFYEGEGRLFTPFASKFSYVTLISQNAKKS